jgi:hypothetical protein
MSIPVLYIFKGFSTNVSDRRDNEYIMIKQKLLYSNINNGPNNKNIVVVNVTVNINIDIARYNLSILELT